MVIQAATASPLSRWERWFLIGALLLQQAAFIPIPEELMGLEGPLDALGNPGDPAQSNPLNFALTLTCLLVLCILSLARLRILLTTIKQNPLVAATALLVLASVAWSYDPTLSLRRAGTYSVGVLLALHLIARCRFDEIVRLIALSTLLPAIASLIYALAMPGLAHMQSPEIADSLRGVYSHKNQLANVMAIGFLVQLYLALSTQRRLRHLALAGLHALLVFEAHSASFTLSLGLILLLLGLYQLGRFNRPLTMLAAAAAIVAVLGLGVGAAHDPDGFFALLGRDATLTGRTDLWPILPEVIGEHPILGWGYAAFWQASNDVVARIWAEVGWQPPHAHNGFLEVAIDLGLLGLSLTCAMLLRFTINARRFARMHGGFEGWVYWSVIAYTMFNNMVEITLLRGQEFAWFCFLVFYMTCAAKLRTVVSASTVSAPSIAARAKPLPGAAGGAASAS
jgi:O-antigen ligase